MLSNILECVEDTAYKIRKVSFNAKSKIELACSFPNESLLATCTSDGSLNIQDLNTRRVLLTLELQLMASNTPGTASATTTHRVNRAWSNMISLEKRMLVFTLKLSNQLLLTSLSNDHAEVFGDKVCLLGCHETPVTTICVDERRSVLISGDSSGCIRLWPLSWDALQSETDSRWRPKPRPSELFQAHRAPVDMVACVNTEAVTISKFVSVGGGVGVVKVWELSADHQSMRASVIQSLECGHDSYIPVALTSHSNLCAMGTKCGKIFVWDLEELELLMVAEEPEGIDCLSIRSSQQSLCICGNKGESVRVFRPDQLGVHWQLMAECYLGGRVLLNEFVKGGDCLVLLAESERGAEDMVLKQWPVSTLPSSSVTLQTQESALPLPRAAPPPLPTPKFKPPVVYNPLPIEPDIEDVVGAEDSDHTDECSEEEVEQEEVRKEDTEEIKQVHVDKTVDMESPYTSRLGNAVLGSTSRAKQQFMEVQRETFETTGHGGVISEEGMKYAARMKNVPLEDKSRYQNLENLNPTLVLPKRIIKKQVDPKWEHSVKTYGLDESDYYVPEWECMSDRAKLGTLGPRESGKELLSEMRKGARNLEADPMWRYQTTLTLNLAAGCFNEAI